MSYKKPVSVLVVIHTPALDVLLLERARHPGFWQSVTGSQEGDEPLPETARREVREETGIEAGIGELTDWRMTNRYEIFAEWRDRYGTRFQPVPARTARGRHCRRRTPGLALAALAGSRGGVLFLDQSRRHPGLAAAHRTDRLAATDSDGILSAPGVS